MSDKPKGWDKVESDVGKGPWGLYKWVIISVIAIVVLFGGLNLVMKPAAMAVDRIVMKNSFQYREGMAQRGAILEANIAEIDMLMAQQPQNREALMGQKRVLTAQLRAITINQ